MPYDLKFKYETNDFALFTDEVVREVCATETFGRLRDISFLGAVEKEKIYKRCAHSRFDHSIGVALLAQYYAEKMDFSESVRRTIVLAALLHDVGHAPLSHSLEPLFIKEFGLDHHIATENLLKGSVPLGRTLNKTLGSYGIDLDELIDLMSGEDKSEKGRIFSAPINIDTMEAIWRGGSYFGKQFTNPLSVLDAFIELDCENGSPLDSFWIEKNTFYQLMIYSKDGIAADHWARVKVEMSRESLVPSDFYLTEKKFLLKHRDRTAKLEESSVDVRVRTFNVDSDVKVLNYESLNNRYCVEKSLKSLVIDPPKTAFFEEMQSSMF